MSSSPLHTAVQIAPSIHTCLTRTQALNCLTPARRGPLPHPSDPKGSFITLNFLSLQSKIQLFNNGLFFAFFQVALVEL